MYVSHFDDPAAWKRVIEIEGVAVSVAPPDLLLAMKLLAGRGRRDSEDIDLLLTACDVTSFAEANEIFGRFYPDHEMAERSRRQLLARLEP